MMKLQPLVVEARGVRLELLLLGHAFDTLDCQVVGLRMRRHLELRLDRHTGESNP